MKVKPGDSIVRMLELSKECKVSMVAMVGLSRREMSEKRLEVDDFEG